MSVEMKATVSLKEAANLILTAGKDVSFMLQGDMGIGKSSLLTELASRLPTHEPVYIDMTTKDLCDISGVPFVEKQNNVNTTRFAPSSELGIHMSKPVIIMLDEFGKAMTAVKNTCLRLLLERKMGEYALHPDSIVFGTTNLMGEGLGDMIQPHARNRVSFLTVQKPNADEWCDWAMNNGVEAEVIAWVNQNPQCLASFTDSAQKDNPYIFHPSKPAGAFVTPRSLTKASQIMKHRATLGHNSTLAGVAGCVGESAARDLMSYAELADKLPTWESIVKNPEKAKLPTDGDAAANFITVYSAIARVEKESFDAWMTYCKRMPMEYQAVFATQISKSSKKAVAIANREFVLWATANHYMYGE